MKVIGALFGFGAILCALIGFACLTKVTLGVGIIGLGAIAGILARLCQADAHHAELKQMVE